MWLVLVDVQVSLRSLVWLSEFFKFRLIGVMSGWDICVHARGCSLVLLIRLLVANVLGGCNPLKRCVFLLTIFNLSSTPSPALSPGGFLMLWVLYRN